MYFGVFLLYFGVCLFIHFFVLGGGGGGAGVGVGVGSVSTDPEMINHMPICLT